MEGDSGFVLPKYNNCKYIDIEVGEIFGHLDILYAMLKHNIDYLDCWLPHKQLLTRCFTTFANSFCSALILKVEDLDRMRLEFTESYDQIFNGSDKLLQNALISKIETFSICEEQLSLYQTFKARTAEDFREKFDS